MFEIRRSDWLNSMSTSRVATEPRAFLPTMHSAHELYPAIMADNNNDFDDRGSVSGTSEEGKSTRGKKFASNHPYGRGRGARARQLAAARTLKRGKVATLATEERAALRPSLTAPAVNVRGEDSPNSAGISRSETKMRMLASDDKKEDDFSGAFCCTIEKILH